MNLRGSLRQLIGSRALQAACLAAIIVALCFTLPPMPEQVPRFAYADKVFHGGYFLLLGMLAALSQRDPVAARRAAWSMVGLGAAIEVVQWFLPWRSFEALDLLADSAGVALGYLVAQQIRAHL